MCCHVSFPTDAAGIVGYMYIEDKDYIYIYYSIYIFYSKFHHIEDQALPDIEAQAFV